MAISAVAAGPPSTWRLRSFLAQEGPRRLMLAVCRQQLDAALAGRLEERRQRRQQGDGDEMA